MAKAKELYPNCSTVILCSMANVSRSGFYEWSNRKEKLPSKDELIIIKLFNKSRGIKGKRRLKMDFERLTKRKINIKKVKRIKRDFILQTVIRKKSKNRAIFEVGEESKVAPNLVQRQFSSMTKEIVLSTDITELKYAYGQKAYLSAVKDLRTKEIVTYAIEPRPTIDLAIGRLPRLIETKSRRTRRRIILHSDQGFQYTSHQYRNAFEGLGIRLSMSRKGNCLDNAPIESFFGHLKDESGYKSCKTLEGLKKCIQNYMNYYNFERPQWGLKRRTPAEAGVFVSLVL